MPTLKTEILRHSGRAPSIPGVQTCTPIMGFKMSPLRRTPLPLRKLRNFVKLIRSIFFIFALSKMVFRDFLMNSEGYTQQCIHELIRLGEPDRLVSLLECGKWYTKHSGCFFNVHDFINWKTTTNFIPSLKTTKMHAGYFKNILISIFRDVTSR